MVRRAAGDQFWPQRCKGNCTTEQREEAKIGVEGGVKSGELVSRGAKVLGNGGGSGRRGGETAGGATGAGWEAGGVGDGASGVQGWPGGSQNGTIGAGNGASGAGGGASGSLGELPDRGVELPGRVRRRGARVGELADRVSGRDGLGGGVGGVWRAIGWCVRVRWVVMREWR